MALAVSAAGLGAVAPAVHADTGARFVLPLSVMGNRIVDANQATVVLNGIHWEGSEIAPSGNAATGKQGPKFPSTTEIQWMGRGQTGSWNANVIRVPVSAPLWMANCPVISRDSTAYRASIDAEVDTITGQGMVALFDLHETAPGCLFPGRHWMPDPDAITFWQDAAQHFAANPLVAFELFNEPQQVTDDVWLAGTQTATVQECVKEPSVAGDTTGNAKKTAAFQACKASKPTYQAIGMQGLYDTVVAAAPSHLVVVDGPDLAQRAPSVRLNAPNGNLVYGLHPYTCTDPASQHCADSAHDVKNLASLTSWHALAADVPLLITEVGWPVYPDNNGTKNNYVDGANFFSETIQYLRDNMPDCGIIGFAFDGWDTGEFALIADAASHAPNSTAVPLYELLSHNP